MISDQWPTMIVSNYFFIVIWWMKLRQLSKKIRNDFKVYDILDDGKAITSSRFTVSGIVILIMILKRKRWSWIPVLASFFLADINTFYGYFEIFIDLAEDGVDNNKLVQHNTAVKCLCNLTTIMLNFVDDLYSVWPSMTMKRRKARQQKQVNYVLCR